MPTHFTTLADTIAENLQTNPFSKWKIKIEVIDDSTGQPTHSHTREISGTSYAHALFEDIKAVLEGEKNITD